MTFFLNVFFQLPGDNVVKVVAVDKVMSRMSTSNHKCDFRFIVVDCARAEEIAIERSRGVVDRIPVVVPREYKIVLEPGEYSSFRTRRIYSRVRTREYIDALAPIDYIEVLGSGVYIVILES